MNHQPFENLIFSKIKTAAEQDELQQHLAHCEACSILSQSLSTFETMVNTSGMLQPANGFLNRWHQNLAERQMNEQSLMVRRFFLFLGVANVATFILIAIFTLLTGSPVQWFIKSFLQISHSVMWVNIFIEAAVTFFSNIPQYFPLIGLISAGIILLVIMVSWILLVWRLAYQGVRNE